MDADKPKTSINLAQNELDKAKAQYAAEKERKIAANDARNPSQPDHSGNGKVRWDGEDGTNARK